MPTGRKFPVIDQRSYFYKNCVTNRERSAKICRVCPFRDGIEAQEKANFKRFIKQTAKEARKLPSWKRTMVQRAFRLGTYNCSQED